MNNCTCMSYKQWIQTAFSRPDTSLIKEEKLTVNNATDLSLRRETLMMETWKGCVGKREW